VAHGAALEKRSRLMASVGSNPTLSGGRGAGVVYQARLESACRLWRPWVRIPPSPLALTASPPWGGFVSVSSYVITLALMLTWHEQNNLSRQESVNR
jgi:hypothetical protein